MGKLYVLDYADMINPAQSRFMIRIPQYLQEEIDKDGIKDGDTVDTTDEEKEIVLKATFKCNPNVAPSKYFLCHWGTSKPYSQYLSDQSDMIKKFNEQSNVQSKEEEKVTDARIMEFKDGKLVSTLISVKPPSEQINKPLESLAKKELELTKESEPIEPESEPIKEPEVSNQENNQDILKQKAAQQSERKNAGQKSK